VATRKKKEFTLKLSYKLYLYYKKVWAKKNQRLSKNIDTNLEVLPNELEKVDFELVRYNNITLFSRHGMAWHCEIKKKNK
jgi:hypothetical protein